MRIEVCTREDVWGSPWSGTGRALCLVVVEFVGNPPPQAILEALEKVFAFFSF